MFQPEMYNVLLINSLEIITNELLTICSNRCLQNNNNNKKNRSINNSAVVNMFNIN